MLTKKRLNYCATFVNIIKTSIETRFRKEQTEKLLVIAVLLNIHILRHCG